MSTKTTGRSGWHQATRNTSESTAKFTFVAACLKAAIVTLALWGVLHAPVAVWLTKRGGSCNV
ncbi:MAG: hypothetical protein Hals2KO_26400 [Halioglobus sp.]